MRELTGVDLWLVPADARVVTTNGVVKRDGCAVMGRGSAEEAARHFPRLPAELGARLVAHGNHAHAFVFAGGTILTMPTKHHWRDVSDLQLILRSAGELMALATALDLKRIVLPRPGCGYGKLQWADVQPELARVLDDRFTAVT